MKIRMKEKMKKKEKGGGLKENYIIKPTKRLRNGKLPICSSKPNYQFTLTLKEIFNQIFWQNGLFSRYFNLIVKYKGSLQRGYL